MHRSRLARPFIFFCTLVILIILWIKWREDVTPIPTSSVNLPPSTKSSISRSCQLLPEFLTGVYSNEGDPLVPETTTDALKDWTIPEVKKCLTNTTIFFFGDSQQRNLYSTLYAYLHNEDSIVRNYSMKTFPESYHDPYFGILMEKRVTKVLDETALDSLAAVEAQLKMHPNRRTVIIQGYSLWYSYWNQNSSVTQFMDDLAKAIQLIKRVSLLSCHIWMPQAPLNLNRQIKWITEALDAQIQQINALAMESLRGTEVVYWQNFLKNAAQDLDNYYDWAHPDFGVLLRDWEDILAALGCSRRKLKATVK